MHQQRGQGTMGKNNNIYSHMAFYVCGLAFFLMALSGCGSPGATCKKACSLIASCHGVELSGDAGATDWICPLSDECSKSELEYCFAKCINNASCEAILGEDADAAAKLQECQVACEVVSTRVDSSTVKDAGSKSDGGDSDLPINCQPSCAGAGAGKECGDDGCGGICGICQAPNRCSSAGQCDCRPSCAGKECGDDGCGESCGTCYSPQTCSAYGQCGCTPNCSGKECGDDGCGGLCGTCSPSSATSCSSAGQCTPLSTGVNTGSLCNASAPCGGSTDACLLFDTADTVGMCLGICQTPGNACSVPNASANMSICALGMDNGQNACAWICEAQGQQFSCPNSYDYTCEMIDASQPDLKICLPKQ